MQVAERFSKYCQVIALLTLTTSCYSSGNRTIEYPEGSDPARQPAREAPQPTDTPVNPATSTILATQDAHLQMDFAKAGFEAYAIDLNDLYYTLSFKDEAGTALIDVPKSRLEFDPASQKGTIKIKVKKGSVGYVTLRVEDGVDANDKFEGRSEKITANGDTPVKMILKKIGDAAITVNVSFAEDDTGEDDGDNGLDGLSAPLQAVAKDLGDPKQWSTPTLVQIEKIARVYCISCHPSTAPGDALSEDFYSAKRITEYMSNKRMPYPGSNDANDLNKLAEAGFDYRAAMVSFAKSLGNNR